MSAMWEGTRGTAPSPAFDGATAPPAPALTPATVAPAAPRPRRSRRGFVAGLVLALAAAGAVAAFVFREPRDAGGGGTVASDEPAFPAACDPALVRQLADARRPGLPDADLLSRVTAIATACPSAAVAQALLGTTLTRLDRDDEAEPHLRAALSLAPGYASAQHNLAVLLVKRGRAVEALPLLDAVLARDATHPTARIARAQARLVTGDAAGAVADLRAQTDRSPDQGRAWALFAEALARSGNREGARSAACRAVALGVTSAGERCGQSPDGPSREDPSP